MLDAFILLGAWANLAPFPIFSLFAPYVGLALFVQAAPRGVALHATMEAPP